VAGPQNLSTGHRRRLGFIDAVTAAGLGAVAEKIRYGALFTEEEGSRACGELLDSDGELTAIVAANDLLAIGCYDALEQRGLRCPEDVSIVGFNDMPFVARLRPALTSVRVPQREIGQVAAELLLERLSGDDEAASEILLDATLIVRDSTASPRNR
jgi:LacI family transcriptional regulator